MGRWGRWGDGERCRVGSAYQKHCQVLHWSEALPTRSVYVDVGWAVLTNRIVRF
ncbi:hypothetical protein [Moorena sp. SIO3A2]|uniref:hypothetical protein n=1 Tax=Moorena sp. SIO3A2 TaxID=2607841 RepID=UPI0013B5E146|nr:hypothetical protein [Moorena sp. SIO3A2]NEQ08527.1 hypothetical protein [Moorena sp. SIO4E2]NEQ12591.1 hypothetical protein [Moorena sp. SIO3E2]NER88838.1 hypothetical protein [Moorena sp. SIO3A2]NES42245.1 hypothetical protein [Moorena sp. SIO2C4]